MSPAIRRRKARAAKVMQDSADDKMSCFVVVVVDVAGVTPGIYIRERLVEEGRGGGDRGAVFRPGGKVAGALTA